ncbi:hypothetical protein AWB80_07514 [Caballeronia pedi]|uniref:Uncharacterized protein n=1 Tax=Caballeronia pedi TaxID=1777141 RepID=A0A158DW46_9BURK|nr:hypothetical protein [Caballeronia pedi]SAK98416.1 hypothetical protein AWB80_07514 [Caballeronia pedi]
MAKALEQFCNDIENIRRSPMAGDIQTIALSAEFLDEVARDVRNLQAQHGVQAENVRTMFSDIEALIKERDALAAQIGELRAARSVDKVVLAAVGGTVKISETGNITIEGGAVEIMGDVKVPA